MAFAIKLAIDNTFSFSNTRSSGIRIVFVTVTSSIGEARSRSTAGPDSSACVANAKMRRAPSRFSAAAASEIVPAVPIMSSGIRQSLSSTSPTTFPTSARLVFSVLPRVAEVREHGRDPRRAGPPCGIHQEQQLQIVVAGLVGGLDDEDIPSTDVFVDLDEDFAVGEPPDRHRAQRLSQMLGHLLGQGPVGRAGEEQQLAA